MTFFPSYFQMQFILFKTQCLHRSSAQQMLSFIQHYSFSIVFCVRMVMCILLGSIVDFYDYDYTTRVDEVVKKNSEKEQKSNKMT